MNTTRLRSLAAAAGAIFLSAGVALAAKRASRPPAKAPINLDNTRWKIHVTVAHIPKFGRASNFNDVLVFRSGTVSGEAMQKQGLDMTPYHAERIKGRKTALQWNFEQINSVGDKYTWQGTAFPRQYSPWKLEGTMTMTAADGQIFKYRLKGTGQPFTPEVPEVTSSGK